jgi:peptidyl-tRNA hydrolase, PTH1 family
MKYLIFGLGNIGEKYQDTRHNIGFSVLNALAYEAKAEFSIDRHAAVASMKYKGRVLKLIKPTTLMNLSGKAVTYWMIKEKVHPDNILVIVDDIALPLGELRMRKKGGDGGHNGLADINQRLGMSKYPRLRFGIGDRFVRGYQSGFVLGEWTKEEVDIINPKVDKAVEMIKGFVTIGIELTMTKFHKDEKPSKPKTPSPEDNEV